VTQRRFPPPWDVEEYNDACFIVRDDNGQALAYVYFEDEPGRRSAAKLLSKDEARRIARFATLNSHHRRGDEEDTRNAKATDAIQVEQTYTARWGAGPNDYIRFRAGFAY
jgi:hypothetical protein